MGSRESSELPITPVLEDLASYGLYGECKPVHRHIYVKLKIKIKSLKRKKCSPGNGKMIQSPCFLPSLTDDLSLVLGAHMMEEDNWPMQVVPWFSHVCMAPINVKKNPKNACTGIHWNFHIPLKGVKEPFHRPVTKIFKQNSSSVLALYFPNPRALQRDANWCYSKSKSGRIWTLCFLRILEHLFHHSTEKAADEISAAETDSVSLEDLFGRSYFALSSSWLRRLCVSLIIWRSFVLSNLLSARC